jgi:hypothetical protein
VELRTVTHACIPKLRRLRQEDLGSRAHLGCTVSLKKGKKRKKHQWFIPGERYRRGLKSLPELLSP